MAHARTWRANARFASTRDAAWLRAGVAADIMEPPEAGGAQFGIPHNPPHSQQHALQEPSTFTATGCACTKAESSTRTTMDQRYRMAESTVI